MYFKIYREAPSPQAAAIASGVAIGHTCIAHFFVVSSVLCVATWASLN